MDHQIFSLQKYGGISKYFASLISNDRSGLYKLSVALSNNENLLTSSLIKNRLLIYLFNQIYTAFNIIFNKYDIYHLTYYDCSLVRLSRGKIVVTIHDFIQELYPQSFTKAQLKRAYQNKKKMLEMADHIIAVSETTKKDAERIYGVPTSKMSVVYHGCDLQDLNNGKVFEYKKDYILYVGNRSGYKNFKTLLSVFCSLKSKDLNLLVVGGGKFSKAELELIKSYKISSKVEWIQFGVYKMVDLYSKSKAFVFPSLYEGFGLPLIEAVLSGAKVIAYENEVFRELSLPNTHYFRNEEELINLINNIDQFNCDNLEIEKLKKYYSWDRAYHETKDVYERVVKL